MARKNLKYELGYRMGYEYFYECGGIKVDAEKEIIRRFGKKTLYSSYGKGFITGFLDHRNNLPLKYE